MPDKRTLAAGSELNGEFLVCGGRLQNKEVLLAFGLTKSHYNRIGSIKAKIELLD